MIKWLDSFEPTYDREMQELRRLVHDGELRCANVQHLPSGDVRFWGVYTEDNALLGAFKEMARDHYRAHKGEPKHIVLMINKVTADDCPTGSGGGWHVDSVRPQYKLFCYLTDCLSTDLGPLCVLTHRVKLFEKALIYANRLFGGGRRYGENVISKLKCLGFHPLPILQKAGVPFFVETSRVHRGMPIRFGERIMLTAYIYEKDIPDTVMRPVELG